MAMSGGVNDPQPQPAGGFALYAPQMCSPIFAYASGLYIVSMTSSKSERTSEKYTGSWHADLKEH